MNISINLLVAEALLLALMFSRVYLYRQRFQSKYFDPFISEVYLRILYCVPLGIMESVSYYANTLPAGTLKNSTNWFFAFGVFSRQMAPSVLIMSVLLGREKNRVLKETDQKSITKPKVDSVSVSVKGE
ncbi:hypothetical protein HDU91_004055 [Kappamyces sp. JEL0680]|nr:hypothetical protein HDU91_004055 [Kappamyces sp. JEL0680]